MLISIYHHPLLFWFLNLNIKLNSSPSSFGKSHWGAPSSQSALLPSFRLKSGNFGFTFWKNKKKIKMVYIKRDRERDHIWGEKSSPALGACYYDNRTILLDYRQGQSRYLIQSPNCLNNKLVPCFLAISNT